MAALFMNEPRKQNGKVWFHHLLWVLENILIWPNPTVEKCIVALLHDAVEDIPWYTIQHVKNVYGEEIANSVNNITKEPLSYYINTKIGEIELNKLEGKAKDNEREELIKKIIKKTRSEDYYGNMESRWDIELDVKFCDRLNSLETMYTDNWNGKNTLDMKQLLKKMWETEKYFLIPKTKEKVDIFYYKNLENKYLERKEKIENWKVKDWEVRKNEIKLN
jgi:hypothetical protein